MIPTAEAAPQQQGNPAPITRALAGLGEKPAGTTMRTLRVLCMAPPPQISSAGLYPSEGAWFPMNKGRVRDIAALRQLRIVPRPAPVELGGGASWVAWGDPPTSASFG